MRLLRYAFAALISLLTLAGLCQQALAQASNSQSSNSQSSNAQASSFLEEASDESIPGIVQDSTTQSSTGEDSLHATDPVSAPSPEPDTEGGEREPASIPANEVTVIDGASAIVYQGVQYEEPAVHIRGGSEHFFQAQEGQLLVQVAPSFGTGESAYSVRGNSFSSDTTTRVIGLGAEYGLSDRLSLELTSSFGEAERKRSNASFTTKHKGFSDPVLKLKGYDRLHEAIRLYYSLAASFSPATAQAATQDTVGSRLSGGSSLQPALGLEFDLVRNAIAGLFADYTMVGESKFEAKNASGSIVGRGSESGGSSARVGAYFETVMRDARLGLAAALTATERSTSIENGSVFESDPTKSLTTSGYALLKTPSGLDIKPVVNFTTLLSRDVNGALFDKNETFSFVLQARMEVL